MSSCCEDNGCEVRTLRERHGRVLWVVLWVNATMFVIELIGGLAARSTSLLADSLDMLGDALVYGVTLVALDRSIRWQAGTAIGKGAFMLLFGVAVIAEAAHKAFFPVTPTAETMGAVGALALVANLVCFTLLYRYRGDNLNMTSTWLCSRNDLIANAGVLIAAGATYLSASRWPDLVVGCIIAAVFLKSAVHVLAQGTKALREAASIGRQHAA